MKAEVKDGVLCVYPSTPTEEYAMEQWRQNNLRTLPVPSSRQDAVMCDTATVLSQHSVYMKPLGDM